ncbi:Na+/H+ antiporter NhaA [Brevibacterium casei]|uniref:Na+/H+ antiporter NhaA n=1 Tax=Brevibacterium casei TaxID=33889 RepID=UPI0036FC0127
MATRFGRGLAAFFRTESAGAVVLLAATVIALLWANLSPSSYNAFIHTEFGFVAGGSELEMSLQHWINDAVMMAFFFLVTLEVKKDVVLGELRSWRRAALPIVGAVAGLIVPALFFVAITRGTPEVGAWGVVISTDTAFVVGILAAFGSRIPAQLRVFILALAVVDDIGALAVIAFFYTEDIDLLWLAIAAALAAVTWFVQKMQAWRGLVYAILGVFLWFAVLQSGVHATIAGVILGLILPVFPPKHQLVDEAEDLTQSFRRSPNAERGMSAAEGILRSVSINDRFQLSLRRVVSLVIVPVFALVNAGVLITPESLSHAFGSALTWGVIVGLVVGKFVGIFGATMLGRRLHIGELSEALRPRHIASGALLTGIGFTISLFIVDLAISDPVAQSDARIGILTGSGLAALLGVISLQLTARYDRKHAPARVQLNRPIDPERDHIYGPPEAKNSLTVYGSFGGLDDANTEEILDQVIDHYEGDINFVFRHIRPTADGAPEQTAEALEAVASQQRKLFWPMRHELNEISEERSLDNRELLRASVNVGANLSRVEDDLRRGNHLSRVDEDYLDAENMGLTRGPVLFVNGLLYQGDMEPNAIIADLDATRAEQPDPMTRPDHILTSDCAVQGGAPAQVSAGRSA